ncbi:MAG: acyl transferase [Ferruginibacter sp.]
MNQPVKNSISADKIFSIKPGNFSTLAMDVFRFQYAHNSVYQQFCKALKIDIDRVAYIQQIPFLPISFFKTHTVTSTAFEPEVIFESSGTTKTINSRHLVKSVGIYEESFNMGFHQFYGSPADWCIIALLPSYLERQHSSLVMMADKLIQESGHPQSGFYLDEFEQLNHTLQILEKQQQKTLLIGVTFALLDFAEKYQVPLTNTIIMETGGMKGRREEMTREQVHAILCDSFKVKSIHSEYGMTELLSQAYSYGNGIFNCPPWMKILLREEDDPLTVHDADGSNILRGAVNIIDLANLYSCSFIASDDAGKLHPDGSFEILGRLDNSDIRGCSLLAL